MNTYFLVLHALTTYFSSKISALQLQCCGVEGPRDWDLNAYFNCSSVAVGSREACGVPFSCCRTKPQEQCGYDVRKSTYVSYLAVTQCCLNLYTYIPFIL